MTVNLEHLHLNEKSVIELEALQARYAFAKRGGTKSQKAILEETRKAIFHQASVVLEAVANVKDKVEHGHQENAMVKAFAKTAGCTEDALRRSIEEMNELNA